MSKLYLLLLVLVNSGVFASMIVKDKRDIVPQGFVSKGAPSLDKTLVMRAALTQNDIKGLEQVLYDISTPGSPNYLQHLTKDEVRHPSFSSSKIQLTHELLRRRPT